MLLDRHFQGFLSSHSLLKESPIDGVRLYPWEIHSPIYYSSQYDELKILGKQAEEFFKFYLESGSDDVIASSIQIHEEGITLGELDFIVNRGGKNVHIELAYKIYLLDGQNWIGPNRKDTLTEKLEKLANHQFPLLNHFACIERLEEIGIEFPSRQELALLGQLYLPLEDNPSMELNQDAVCGHWCRFDQFETQKPADAYYLPVKKDWFINSPQNHEWIYKEECFQRVSASLQNQRSCMILLKRGERIERMFVVWW